MLFRPRITRRIISNEQMKQIEPVSIGKRAFSADE